MTTIPFVSQYDKEKFRELAADADLQDDITPAMIISLANAAKSMREERSRRRPQESSAAPVGATGDGGNPPRRKCTLVSVLRTQPRN